MLFFVIFSGEIKNFTPVKYCGCVRDTRMMQAVSFGIACFFIVRFFAQVLFRGSLRSRSSGQRVPEVINAEGCRLH